MIWSAQRAARCRSACVRTAQVTSGRPTRCRASQGPNAGRSSTRISHEVRPRRQGRAAVFPCRNVATAASDPNRDAGRYFAATMPRGRRGAFCRSSLSCSGSNDIGATGPRYPASTAATRAGRRSSPSNRLFSSSSMVARPPTRSQSSPSVIMRSALPRNGNALELGGAQAIEPPFALGEAAEHIVVMHHGLAIGADLQIDLDAVAGGDRGAHRSRRVLDDAVRGVMQPAMGDRSRGEPVERRSPLFRTLRTGPRPRSPHRAARPRRRPSCARACPSRRRPRPSGRRRRSSPSARRRNPAPN